MESLKPLAYPIKYLVVFLKKTNKKWLDLKHPNARTAIVFGKMGELRHAGSKTHSVLFNNDL